VKRYILVLDEGTTSVKSLVYNRELELVGSVSKKIESVYPGPRLVEQDPEKIYSLVVDTCREAVKNLEINPEDIACAAIANQRNSFVFWDGATQKPLHNVITWQDTRGVDHLSDFVGSPLFNQYFPGLAPYIPSIYTPVVVSATKILCPEFAAALSRPGVKWGNIDSWLLYKLTDGQTHATTLSTASNSTMLDQPTGAWNTYIAQFAGMRDDMFPEIREENAGFGMMKEEILGIPIPISCMMADQQAAMFSQGCFLPTVAKCTNGSGTFVNVNIGEEFKEYGNLTTTIAWKLDGKTSFMSEGGSYTAGSCLEWAQSQLELYGSVRQLDEDASSVADSGGVYFVPALGGMAGPPYNDPTARASFMGIGPSANRKHFARAVLESIAFAAAGAVKAFLELGIDIRKLSVSGGVSSSDIAVQLMSNILGMEIARPRSIEATGLGIAALAAVKLGWLDKGELQGCMQIDKVFAPDGRGERDLKRFIEWKKAVDRSLKWLEA
jgi:glycerol kinase